MRTRNDVGKNKTTVTLTGESEELHGLEVKADHRSALTQVTASGGLQESSFNKH